MGAPAPTTVDLDPLVIAGRSFRSRLIVERDVREGIFSRCRARIVFR